MGGGEGVGCLRLLGRARSQQDLDNSTQMGNEKSQVFPPVLCAWACYIRSFVVAKTSNEIGTGQYFGAVREGRIFRLIRSSFLHEDKMEKIPHSSSRIIQEHKV